MPADGHNRPLSAIHPHPLEQQKARFVQEAFGYEPIVEDPLTEVLRRGAGQLLIQAVEAEIAVRV